MCGFGWTTKRRLTLASARERQFFQRIFLFFKIAVAVFGWTRQRGFNFVLRVDQRCQPFSGSSAPQVTKAEDALSLPLYLLCNNTTKSCCCREPGQGVALLLLSSIAQSLAGNSVWLRSLLRTLAQLRLISVCFLDGIPKSGLCRVCVILCCFDVSSCRARARDSLGKRFGALKKQR